MKLPNSWQARQNRWWLLLALVAVISIFGATIYHVATGHNLDKDPIKSTAIEVHNLIGVSKQLKTNFNDANTARATRNYIGDLNVILQACQWINRYHGLKPGGNLSAQDALLISQSNDLCQDLTKLAGNSGTIYLWTEPLLTASTKLQRYQTLPPFAGLIRNQQKADVAAAIKQFNGLVPKMDFPTQALMLLKQLQISILSSHGLKYYPALQLFQSRLLAERLEYWTGYADLTSLMRTLQSQQVSYCQQLKSENSSLSFCHS